MGRAPICRCLLLSTWSPALSFAVSPCSPAGVVVRYVVVATRSRGPGKIAVPRERLYRNSDCQISQVILCQAGATASPSVILSEAEESVFSPRSIFASHETKIPGIPARGGAYVFARYSLMRCQSFSCSLSPVIPSGSFRRLRFSVPMAPLWASAKT